MRGVIELELDDALNYAEVNSLARARKRMRDLQLMRPKDFAKLDEWAKAEAGTAAGQTLDTIENGYEVLRTAALDRGVALDKFIAMLRPEWKRPLGMRGKDPTLLTEAHLENVLRTNSMRAYNHGWNDSAYLPGMEERRPGAQLVAVRDDRTTQVCRNLDRKVFPRDMVPRVTPPLHFQCRSVLIWLSADEFAELSARGQLVDSGAWGSLPAKHLPQKGFGAYRPVLSRAA